MKILKRNIVTIALMAAVIVICTIISLNSCISEVEDKLTNDDAMSTNYYESDVKINNDNSYSVKELIDVNFKSPRHGIYRYIPYMGYINDMANENIKRVPYYSDFELIYSNTAVNSIENSNGTKCITFGDKDVEVKGSNKYIFEYKITPKTQNEYNSIYYNIFPIGWRNEIPQGSSFRIEFPKEISKDDVNLYYGNYGENKDASEVLDINWNGNVLTGKLTRNIPLGSGITLYTPVKAGYFTEAGKITEEVIPIILLCILISLCAVLIYFKYGKDEKVIPAVQFNPPDDLDSAACGYIIDGLADNEDIISLIIYLADKGYIKIERNNKDEISLIKIMNIPGDSPQYIKTVFYGIFEGKDSNMKVKLSSLKYKFAPKMDKSKGELKAKYNHFVYAKSSRVWKAVLLALTILPFSIFIMYNTIKCYTLFSDLSVYTVFIAMYGAGVVVLSGSRDIWYCMKTQRRFIYILHGAVLCFGGIFGLYIKYTNMVNLNLAYSWKLSFMTVIVSTVILSIVSVFLKSRAEDSGNLLGFIIGFKEFIENAELDRIKLLAEDNPQWFYRVLPYAYVFGLSDIWIKKFKDISLPKPGWYYGMDDSFSFYAFNTMLIRDLNTAEKICVSVQTSSGAGGTGSSGGGGFSGGGFGGGGGGSW